MSKKTDEIQENKGTISVTTGPAKELERLFIWNTKYTIYI